MEPKIDREAYLAYARNYTEVEKRNICEFTEWLPEKIIDSHAHCGLAEHVRWIDDRACRHMLSTFPSFSLEESKELHMELHPGKTVRTLRFAKTFRGIDHKAANNYLLEQSPEQDRMALYGLPDDVDYTTGMLMHPRVSALKMYYSYLEPPATEIYQYFPKAVLETAQDRNIPIILHPPRRITVCLDQILNVIRDFPRLRICLAHLSMTKHLVPGLEETFSVLSEHSQVSFDTALVPSAEVVGMALRIVSANRIMYGSDQPLHLIRSVAYDHPRLGERIVTEYPYHWVDAAEQQEFKHLAVGATHMHWQALRAIKEAIVTLPKNERENAKQKMFHDNARSFYLF